MRNYVPMLCGIVLSLGLATLHVPVAHGKSVHEETTSMAAWIMALKDSDAQQRKRAANAIGRMAHGSVARQAAPALLKTLKDPDQGVRHEATLALSTMLRRLGPDGAMAIAPLVSLLADPADDIRVSAAMLLGAVSWDRRHAGVAVPALITALKDPYDHVREAAAKTLHQLDSAAAPAAPVLASLLRDPNTQVRSEAGDTLMRMGANAASAVPTLLRLLEDPDEHVKSQAAWALGVVGGHAPETLPALRKALRDRSHLVRDHAAHGIVCYAVGPSVGGSMAMGAMLEEWAISNVSWPNAAAKARLGLTLSTRVIATVPDLTTALSTTTDSGILVGVAMMLGLIGPASAPAVPTLASLLKHPDEHIRMAAVWALGGIGAHEAAVGSALETAQHDASVAVQRIARAALTHVQQ